jgi:HSP20 family molecular chaperone IbpA
VDVEQLSDGTRVALRVACPGLVADEVTLVLDGTTLRLRAEHADEATRAGARAESRSMIAHAVNVPAGTTADGVSAWLTDGLLEVSVPAVPAPAGATAVPVRGPSPPA